MTCGSVGLSRRSRAMEARRKEEGHVVECIRQADDHVHVIAVHEIYDINNAHYVRSCAVSGFTNSKMKTSRCSWMDHTRRIRPQKNLQKTYGVNKYAMAGYIVSDGILSAWEDFNANMRTLL